MEAVVTEQGMQLHTQSYIYCLHIQEIWNASTASAFVKEFQKEIPKNQRKFFPNFCPSIYYVSGCIKIFVVQIRGDLT